ncbi:MAG: hypothetical protein ACOYO2_02695 [Mycobacterium sp.]
MGAVLVAEFAAATVLISGGTAAVPAHSASSSSSVVVDGRTVRLVSLGGARTDALLTRVGADIGGAVTAVEGFWGTDWQREIVVVATDSDAQFVDYAHLDQRQQWTDIAAVSIADEVDLAGRRTSGQRIVLAPGAAAMSDSALRIVLAHELFHFAARADTALDAPRWLTEGVADFVARPQSQIPADVTTALPSDAALEVRGSERAAGYDRAWWFARFVADTYGIDGLRRLYAAACGPGHGDLAAAVRQELGVDMDGLHIRWAQWLTAGRHRR